MTPIPVTVDKAKIHTVLMKYFGARYKLNATGPKEFDCQTFTRVIQKELFDRDLPVVHLEDESLATYMREILKYKNELDWQVIDKPVHGCIVEMSHAIIPHHLGTYLDIDGGGVLHCVRGAGVAFDSMLGLKASGWRRFIYDYPKD